MSTGSRCLFAAALLLVLPLAGCTQPAELPRLTVAIGQTEVQWGQAAQLTIRNVGEGPAPAPITVEVVSTNGTVVFSYEDVTGGRGLPAGGQVSVHWNGTDQDGRPVLWGTYTMRLPDYQHRATVELLRPPNFAMTVDPIPRETPAGEPVQFKVNNTGTTWLNGTLTVAAGRQDNILYTSEVDVQLAPGDQYDFFWNGKTEDGQDPEAKTYLVGARMETTRDGPTPYAQDVFQLR